MSKRDALAAGTGEQAIPGVSDSEEIRDISEAGLPDFEPEEATSLTGYTAVSEGQRQHIDYLLSTVDDDLAWVALVVVKEYGLPSKEQYAEYMSQFAGSGLDDESDRLALELLDQVRHSDWDDMLAHADSAPVETTAQDLADNTIEGLTVIDAKTGRTLLNRAGVLGAGGQQYVGLQDYEVEAFKGLDLIFIHNHPNGSDASEADLRAAFEAGAEMLMVVTPQGYEYVYIRGPRGMIRIRAEEASYEVAPGTAEEHALLEARSWAQGRADQLNPPELVFLQQDPEYQKHLVDIALELNIESDPTALSVIELLREVLAVAEADAGAFHEAVPAFLDIEMPHIGHTLNVAKDFQRALFVRETAKLTGVDPAILAMVQLFEDSVRIGSPTEHGSFEVVYATRLPNREKSFGIAQVQVPTAIQMLKNDQMFGDLNLPIATMRDANKQWIHKEVARQLYENESFSIRVAGVYLMQLQAEIRKLLQNLDVAVAGGNIDQPHPSGLFDRPYISPHELLMLAVGAYNQGTSLLYEGLPERHRKRGPEYVIEGVEKTGDIGYIHDVFSMAGKALEKYGLIYRGNRDEE